MRTEINVHYFYLSSIYSSVNSPRFPFDICLPSAALSLCVGWVGSPPLLSSSTEGWAVTQIWPEISQLSISLVQERTRDSDKTNETPFFKDPQIPGKKPFSSCIFEGGTCCVAVAGVVMWGLPESETNTGGSEARRRRETGSSLYPGSPGIQLAREALPLNFQL